MNHRPDPKCKPAVVRSASAIALGLIGAIALGSLGACAGDKAEQGERLLGNKPSRPTPAPPAGKPPEMKTAQNSADNDKQGADGLETLWWVADDTAGAVGRRLAQYVGQRPPLDEAQIERLRGMGLRAITVPLGELDTLRASMTAAGPTQRRWLGQLPDWTVLVEGGNWPGGVRASVGAKQVDLDPGRLRWLVRAWTTPVTINDAGQSRIGAALRVELVPQVEDARPRYERLLEQAAADGTLSVRNTGPDRDGPLVDPALLSLELTSNDVIVLVPESPDVDWLAEMEPSDRTGRTDSVQGGPSKPAAITLGEAMLAQDTAAGGRVKVIVALIPRVPTKFKLMP